MKEKEAYIDYEPHQLMLYVEKDDGTYGPMITGSHLSKNYIDDYFEKMEKLRLSLLLQLKDNIISPVEYYRVIHDFNVFELSKRTKISVFKVKKHLKAKGFHTAKVADLMKYADVFSVPVSNLFQVIIVEGRDSETKNGIPDENIYKVQQTKTLNPLLVISKFELNKK